VRWVAINVGLFIGAQAAYVGLLALLVRAPVGIGATLLSVAALFTAPFLPIYLLVVAALPASWSHRGRRGTAIAASPLLLTVFIGLAFLGGPGPFLLAVALPGSLAYGALVRLREPPSSAASVSVSFAGHYPRKLW
jgi:hypothetical protein